MPLVEASCATHRGFMCHVGSMKTPATDLRLHDCAKAVLDSFLLPNNICQKYIALLKHVSR